MVGTVVVVVAVVVRLAHAFHHSIRRISQSTRKAFASAPESLAPGHGCRVDGLGMAR